MLGDYLLAVDANLGQARRIEGMTCYNVQQDRRGYYWVGCNDGLLRLDESLDNAILYPDLTRIAINSGTPLTVDADGRLWACAQDGVYIVHPEADFASPRVRITNVTVNGSERADYHALHIDSTFTVYADEQAVSFRFFSLGYDCDQDVRKWQYRLDGVDTAWIVRAGINQADYYNLPHGSYTFHVRGFGNAESEDTVTFTVRPGGSHILHNVAMAGVVVLAVVGVAWFVVFVLRRRQAEATAADAPQATVADTPAPVSPAKEKKLSPDEAEQVSQALCTYMEGGDTPYLNPDLKQSDVAKAIGCPVWMLSLVLNRHLLTNYNDYVNRYRVERFCQAVRRGDHKHFMLMGLAEKCGFASRSSFFRAFKKFKGTTPNDYIKSMNNEVV